MRIRAAVRGVVVAVAVGAGVGVAQAAERVALIYAPAPADNPLKGLVPYAGQGGDRFPHSLEFSYLALGALVKGPGQYDWGPLEQLLDAVASRGHQAVFRVYLEYPGHEGAIPAYLVEQGLKVHRYQNTNTQPFPPKPIETPDYEDPGLRRCLRDFIEALGAKYDGDPRVGFLTAGLLGTWGEWHTHPRTELWASKAVQAEVMDAYERAFRRTPVLLRYPAGPDDPAYAANDRRPFGYHDDSFAWATLDTGRKSDGWFYMAKLRTAGALDKWRTRPIGGEIRPEAWGQVFDAEPDEPAIQDFARCVEATHATWLMDSGLFGRKATDERRRRALDLVRRMGYEFHVPGATIGLDDGALRLQVELENRGVAPFYHDWGIEYALLSEEGTLAHRQPGRGPLTGLGPGDAPRVWEERIGLEGVGPGSYRVLVRAVNPLPGGKALRFANAEQDRGRDGWLTLGRVVVPGVR